MTRHHDANDYEDEDEWDDDGGDDRDSDDEPTVPCPYCRREIFEDSPFCTFCERYISSVDQPGLGKPLWVVATALLCLGIAVWWLFAGV
jgi:hypothetical protein